MPNASFVLLLKPTGTKPYPAELAGFLAKSARNGARPSGQIGIKVKGKSTSKATDRACPELAEGSVRSTRGGWRGLSQVSTLKSGDVGCSVL